MTTERDRRTRTREFVIPLQRLGTSQNSRLHELRRWELNRSISDLAFGYAHNARIGFREPVSLERRAILMWVEWPRHHPGRLPDRDNLVGMLKPVLDGIVRAGWMHDDSDAFCDYQIPQQQRGPGEQLRVHVRISGIGEAEEEKP